MNNCIIINIGLDVFIEMTFDQALEHLESKRNILNKKLIYFNEILAKNQAHYKVTEKILNELNLQIEIDKNI